MNILKKLLALPLAVVAIVATDAHAQLTCDQPLPIPLGATPTATLLSFPALQVQGPCQGAFVLHHAVFHRFTASEDGWYSMHVVPSDATAPWQPQAAILPACDASAAEMLGHSQFGRVACDTGDANGRYYASASFRLQAGQSKTIVVGGYSVNDAGSAMLHVARIGSTLMDGATPLALGSNQYAVAAREPIIPFVGSCGWITDDRIANASRFSFVPAKAGTYRFGFCGSGRRQVALSTSPNLEHGTVTTAMDGCPSGGGRLTAQLQAGTTYYVAAGFIWANDDGCLTRTATVEYVDPCPADFNDDDVTDGIDLGILLAAWGTPARDITGDGVTDGVDLGILLAMWGPCPD
jgi:hypothetical protein